MTAKKKQAHKNIKPAKGNVTADVHTSRAKASGDSTVAFAFGKETTVCS